MYTNFFDSVVDLGCKNLWSECQWWCKKSSSQKDLAGTKGQSLSNKIWQDIAYTVDLTRVGSGIFG